MNFKIKNFADFCSYFILIIWSQPKLTDYICTIQCISRSVCKTLINALIIYIYIFMTDVTLIFYLDNDR